MGKRRWLIGALLAVGVIVNYFDRVNLSVGGGLLASEFHITPFQMGLLFSSFGWTYAILQIPVGALLDKIGVKWIMRAGTIIWTVATLMITMVSGVGLIFVSRLLLGVAEAPFFPGNTKATGYWFPLKERSRAIALFDSESKLSSAIGISVVSLVVAQWGWRGGFYATGVLSLLYAVAYWVFYRDPKDDKKLTKEEYEYITEGGAQSEGAAPGGIGLNLRYLLRQRKIWAVLVGFSCYGYTWWLFLTWLPDYLTSQLHMSIIKSGWYGAIPWLVGFATEMLVGGWLVDYFVNKGYNPTRVRKTFVVMGLILGMSVIGASYTTNPNIAVALISISLGGLVITSSVTYTVPTLIAPKGTTATVMGIFNFGNNIAGIIAPIVTGLIVSSTGSFSSAFIVAGVLLAAGIVSFVFFLPDLDPIPSPISYELDDKNKRTA